MKDQEIINNIESLMEKFETKHCCIEKQFGNYSLSDNKKIVTEYSMYIGGKGWVVHGGTENELIHYIDSLLKGE